MPWIEGHKRKRMQWQLPLFHRPMSHVGLGTKGGEIGSTGFQQVYATHPQFDATYSVFCFLADIKTF